MSTSREYQLRGDWRWGYAATSQEGISCNTGDGDGDHAALNGDSKVLGRVTPGGILGIL